MTGGGILTAVGPRADNDAVKEAVGLAGAGVVSVFAEIRRRKDHFRGTRVGRT